MDDWPTLPQLAREIGIAESTARRWASAFAGFLRSHGRGSARRFHPQAREVLRRIKTLYDSGLTTEQVAATLAAEFPAHVDVPEQVIERRARELEDLVVAQARVIERLSEELAALRAEVAATRQEVRALAEREWSTLTIEDVRRALEESRIPWWRRLFRWNSLKRKS